MGSDPDKPAECWAPLTTVRPFYDFASGGDEIEICNAVTRKRYTVSREAMLGLIAASDFGSTSVNALEAHDFFSDEGIIRECAVNAVINSEAEHWYRRGWGSSLEFFEWTRNTEFADLATVNEFRSVRDEIVSAMTVDEGGAAPPTRVASGNRKLASPADLPNDSLGRVLHRRSSVLKPKSRPLSEEILSSLLWYGLAPGRYPRKELDSYDALISFGRLFQTFVVTYQVDGIESGVFFYDTISDRIELVRPGEFREQVSNIIIGQPHAKTASCSFFIAVDFRTIQWLYRHDRVLRNVYINAGKILQSLLLVATSYQLTTSMSAAIKDTEALTLLGLDPANDQVLYVMSVG